MKAITVIIFLVFLIPGFKAIAQDKQIQLGFWQEKTSSISDAHLGGYNFTNTTFEYTVNGYDGLNPISAFGGKYIIKNGKIFFTVTYLKKYTGGQLCRSQTSTLNDSWAIEGGKITMVKLKPAISANASIEVSNDCLVIDRQKYYKTDPN